MEVFMRKLFYPVFILFFYQLHAQQVLSRKEKGIVDQVNKNIPQSLRLLEELVNTNSGTLNTTGVKTVGNRLRKAFDSIGFTTEWINLPDSLKRAGHLVASHKGKKGKKIFLI